MKITTIVIGPLETNCYVVSDPESLEAMVIDPGDEPDTIEDFIKGLDVRYIVLTHAHFDHSGAVPELKKSTGASLAVHEAELDNYRSVSEQAAFWGYDVGQLPEPDVLLKEGDTLKLGPLSFEVMHTPGHSPGSITLMAPGAAITGDTLFQGSVGRTDFPGGSDAALKASFKRLMGLPPDTAVYPGHGPATTIGAERTGNILSFTLS